MDYMDYYNDPRYDDAEVEMVTFVDWLLDTGIEPHALKMEARLLRPLWDTYGKDYIRQCKEDGKDYEVI